MLSKREAKAAELRKKTERAASMNPQQLNQLRNDVKHFVSERHFDEELGKGVQFVYDAKVLENIPSFGECKCPAVQSAGQLLSFSCGRSYRA